MHIHAYYLSQVVNPRKCHETDLIFKRGSVFCRMIIQKGKLLQVMCNHVLPFLQKLTLDVRLSVVILCHCVSWFQAQHKQWVIVKEGKWNGVFSLNNAFLHIFLADHHSFMFFSPLITEAASFWQTWMWIQSVWWKQMYSFEWSYSPSSNKRYFSFNS